MNTVNPTINTPHASGIKRLYANVRNTDIKIYFNSNEKLYNPRVSVYTEVNAIPGSPITNSTDGTPFLSIPVGGDTGDQPVDVIFDGGVIQAKEMYMMCKNHPWDPMFSGWKNDLCVRSYHDARGSWVQLCKLDFTLINEGSDNGDITFMDTPGGFITWESGVGDSIEVNLHFTAGEDRVPDNKRVYFKFEFDCDGESNHTHTKWGILTLKKDPVSSINIIWHVL